MTDDSNSSKPGFGDLESPFLFVPHGSPEPTEWMRKHPGWVKFPATFVPRAPAAVRTIPGTNRPWPLDKRGQPWPRSRFGQPLRPLDEYPPGVRAPGEGYTGPIADPDEAMRAAMASQDVLVQAAKYAADPDAPVRAYLSAMKVWQNPAQYARHPRAEVSASAHVPSQAERDADAIRAGMNRARAAGTGGDVRVAANTPATLSDATGLPGLDAAGRDLDETPALRNADTDGAVPQAVGDVAAGASGPVANAGTRILKDNPTLRKQWEFTQSAWTGQAGPTRPLEEMLRANGIEMPNLDRPNPPPPGSITKTGGVPVQQATNINGTLAENAIAARHRAQGYNVRVQVPVQDGARRVDVQVDVPAEDPRLSERIEIESKTGRASMTPDTVRQVGLDAEAVATNKGVRVLGRGAEIAGKALMPVAIGADALQLGQAYQADGDRIGDNTARTAAGIAGSWGGAFAGARTGAALGGALGSVVPGVGTAMGAVVGGVAGGITGAVLGDSAARTAYDDAKGKR